MATRRIPPGEFVPPPRSASLGVAQDDTYVVPPGPGFAHAATAVALDGGRVAVYWYAGSKEAGPDVALLSAVYDGDTWGLPTVVDAVHAGSDQGRLISTVGNPIVFRHPSGEYWLIYVTVTAGGWSASALNLMRSPDGVAWSRSRRLVTSPFFNLSTLVKGPPLIRDDGLVVVPTYHELVAAFPEFVIIDEDGAIVDRVRVDGKCLIQPWPVALGEGRAIALMRQHGCAAHALHVTETADGGLSWGAPRPISIANPGSPTAATVLVDGTIIAIANDQPGIPYVLSLASSTDDGRTWRIEAPLLDGRQSDRTFRYPWLLREASGAFHLFVTESDPDADITAIRHIVLSGGRPSDARIVGRVD
jgi:predicted neuraminidase